MVRGRGNGGEAGPVRKSSASVATGRRRWSRDGGWSVGRRLGVAVRRNDAFRKIVGWVRRKAGTGGRAGILKGEVVSCRGFGGEDDGVAREAMKALAQGCVHIINSVCGGRELAKGRYR